MLLLLLIASSLPAQSDSVVPQKSPETALALSLGATAIPFVLASANSRGSFAKSPVVGAFAFFIGPALGHFYAGQSGRALGGMAIRFGLAASTAFLASQNCTNSTDEWFCASPALVIGGIAIMAAIVVDIVAAPGSARKYNEQHPRLAIVPLNNGPETRIGVGVRLEIGDRR